MWRSSQASTYVCRVPCKRLLWSTSLPRKVLLSTGIRQHVFSCRLKGDSNRKSLCSDQIFGYFSSYLTTISRKQYGQSSCNGCSRHLTSHSLTSTVADCFSSSPDSDFSHSLIHSLGELGFKTIIDGEAHRFPSKLLRHYRPDCFVLH